MEATKGISALFNLIDDPDEEVFGAVSDRIIDYGRTIIPSLEHLWETVPEEHIQQRIELIIHRLHYRDLSEDFRQWNLAGHHDLMLGAMLAARFQYPEVSNSSVLQEIEKIRRNIWLELNNYLTPLEQTNIVTSILYSYYGLKGSEVNFQELNEFFLHKVLEAKRGNQVSNGILYLVMAELLDIPVKAIRIPKQFVLAYFKPGYSGENLKDYQEKIEFFIDPINGQVFTHKDVQSYFNRINSEIIPSYFKPQSNKQVIRHLLEETGKCFTEEQNQYKQKELAELADLLEE